MMELCLQPPSIPLMDSFYERQLSEWEQALAGEVAQDIQVWGSPGWGTPQTFQQALTLMSTDYFQPRRIHLFETHLQSGELPGPTTQVRNIVFGQMESDPSSGDQNEEWLEVKNLGMEAVDLSGWQLSGGVDFLFPAGTVIPPLDTLYLSPAVKSFRNRVNSPRGGENLFVIGPFMGDLNAGEDLFLWNQTGGLEDSNSTSFALFLNQFVAGEDAAISVAGATPLGKVLVAWSLTGSGPTSTPLGPADLSMPIQVLPGLVANSSGTSLLELSIPPASAGVQVWLQALDVPAAYFSNGETRIIE